MKSSIAVLFLVAMAATANAKTEGVEAIRARRQTMQRVEKPVAQLVKDGKMLSVYADDTVKTQAVRIVRMATSTVAKVESLVADRETLKAAKALAKAVKANHAKSVEGLTDAEIVAVSATVTNTSARDSSAAGAIGLLLGAAAAEIANGKKTKEDKPSKDEKDAKNK